MVSLLLSTYSGKLGPHKEERSSAVHPKSKTFTAETGTTRCTKQQHQSDPRKASLARQPHKTPQKIQPRKAITFLWGTSTFLRNTDLGLHLCPPGLAVGHGERASLTRASLPTQLISDLTYIWRSKVVSFSPSPSGPIPGAAPAPAPHCWRSSQFPPGGNWCHCRYRFFFLSRQFPSTRAGSTSSFPHAHGYFWWYLKAKSKHVWALNCILRVK